MGKYSVQKRVENVTTLSLLSLNTYHGENLEIALKNKSYSIDHRDVNMGIYQVF
jgi:hypothetical protein